MRRGEQYDKLEGLLPTGIEFRGGHCKGITVGILSNLNATTIWLIKEETTSHPVAMKPEATLHLRANARRSMRTLSPQDDSRFSNLPLQSPLQLLAAFYQLLSPQRSDLTKTSLVSLSDLCLVGGQRTKLGCFWQSSVAM